MPKVSDSNGAEWGDSDLNVFGIAGFSVFDAVKDAAQSLIEKAFQSQILQLVLMSVKGSNFSRKMHLVPLQWVALY